MGNPNDQKGRIEALRVLMDRLCSPDLTLGEAKPLRDELTALLGTVDPSGASGTPGPALAPDGPDDGSWDVPRSHATLMLALA